MIRFALGLLIPFVGITIWEVASWSRGTLDYWFRQDLSVPAIAYSAAIVTASTIAILWNHARPKGMFARGRRKHRAAILSGVLVGVLTILIAVPVVIWGVHYAPDWVLLAFSAIPASIVVLRFSAGLKPGACPTCDFDMRASLNHGRCPECGQALGTYA